MAGFYWRTKARTGPEDDNPFEDTLWQTYVDPETGRVLWYRAKGREPWGGLDKVVARGKLALRGGDIDGALLAAGQAVLIEPEDPDVWTLFALSFERLGMRRAALGLVGHAVALAPNALGARRQYARLLVEHGRLEDALNVHRGILAVNPREHRALTIMGNLLVRLERHEEAAGLYRAALAIEPDSLAPAVNLVVALLCQGARGPALDAAEAALERHPGNGLLHRLKVESLLALGDPAAALAALDEAAAAGIDGPAFQARRAAVLAGLGETGAARLAAQRALAADPRDPVARLALANAQRLEGQLEAALASLEAILATTPEDPRAHFQRGLVLGALGLPHEALAALDRAALFAPADPEVHHERRRLLLALREDARAREADHLARRAMISLSRMTVLASSSADPDRLADRLRQPALSEAERIGLLFDLAAALDRLGETGPAMAVLEEANQRQRRRLAFSVSAFVTWTERLRAAFSPRLFERLAGAGITGSGLVFVIGMPRSGTTLVEQILAANPGAQAAGEAEWVGQVVAAQGAELDLPYPDWVPALGRGQVEALARAVLARRRRRFGRAPAVVIDKSIGNIAHAGLIRLMFPDAPLLWCGRDPLDQALSNLFQLYGLGAHPYSYDVEEYAAVARAHAQLLDHWRRHLPGPLLVESAYEALVTEPATQIPRLVAATGLAWDPASLEPWRLRRRADTASGRQIQAPITDRAIGRARPYRAWLAPVVRALEG